MDSTTLEIQRAKIESSKASKNFEYDRIRDFQKDSLEWFKKDNSEPLLILQAPTGSGKTAVFADMLKRNRKSLVIYPTNALLHQQRDILNQIDGINPQIISSRVLDEKDEDNRADSLQNIVDRPHNNVLLTNPDILQAILQGQYVDPTDKLVRRFFEYIDTIIYDEFHFYDEFETSGIALQLKVLSERLARKDANPDIVLSSATPNKDYLDYINNELNIQTRRAKGIPTAKGCSVFRHKTRLDLCKEPIEDNFNKIIDKLNKSVRESEDLSNPSVAVIFNSAKKSNRFQSILVENYPQLAQQTKKDNGYDTYSETEETSDYYILNTTSKGEVGLDFDIKELYMECPYDAPSFIQRFGRAGRKSEADVKVFNIEIAEPPREDIGYKEFVDYIYREMRTPQMNSYRIKNLIALRAATAVYNRENDKLGYNKEIYSDFADVDLFSKWKKFLDNSTTEDGKWVQPSKNAEKIIEYIRECNQKILTTLRGTNVSVKVLYPVGEENKGTEYDIVTAVAHYEVTNLDYDNSIIELGEQRKNSDIEIELKHFNDLRENFYDYRRSELRIEKIKRMIHDSNIERVTEMKDSEIIEFFEILESNGKIAGKIHIPNKSYSPIKISSI